jgi:hypothetical protein
MRNERGERMEIVFEQDDVSRESSPPAFVRLMGCVFRLWRREVVARGGERARLRITYRSTDLADGSDRGPDEKLGGRGGPDDNPVATGGDGFQTEPPTPRD